MTDDNGGIEIHIPKRLSWVTVGGFIVIVAASVAGYLTLQNSVSALAHALTELTRTVETNYQFQVEQRVRVWDRVNQLEQEQQRQRELAAAVGARLSSIEQQLGRALDILEEWRP